MGWEGSKFYICISFVSVASARKSIPELYDLVEKYEPDIIWSDGYGPAHSDYWNVKEFLAWYATNSTVNETAVYRDW